MTIRDFLKKKDRIEEHAIPATTETLPHASQFTFVRTDTNTQDAIKFPTYESDEPDPLPRRQTTPKKHFSRLRGLSQSSVASSGSPPQKEHKRLSQRLHLGHKKSDSASSINIPTDLPDISEPYGGQGDQQEKEAQWEDRATRLATQRPTTPGGQPDLGGRRTISASPRRTPSPSVSDAQSDVNIQEAIRLHESGQLRDATRMFHKLADRGNVLSQVLYGLSLRHGWGCEPDLERAVQYLSSAASNSASIEAEALKAGMKKGGAAKGELVLAIFELGNCYRYGWGIPVDKAAARQYYETAANLGDTDAMNEAAWCYLEGFGGKKDKFKAAQLLRLAENSGSKTLGNTWIWKEKYNPK